MSLIIWAKPHTIASAESHCYMTTVDVPIIMLHRSHLFIVWDWDNLVSHVHKNLTTK